jgi:hypothetical protein
MHEEPENIDKGDDSEDATPLVPAGKAKKPEPTSAAVVSDPSAKQRRKLETRIATLEDQLDVLKSANSDYETKLSVLAKTPSQTNPHKTILQELEEFCAPITAIFTGKPPTKE